MGALLSNGYDEITAIERDPEYAAIARARVAWWQDAIERYGTRDPGEILKAAAKTKPPAPKDDAGAQQPLFEAREGVI